MQTLKYVIGKDYRPLLPIEARTGTGDTLTYNSKSNWVQARQFEDSLRQVFVEITNEDGTPFDLTGCNALFEGILPDGVHKILDNSHVVFYDDPSGGKFRFDMPASAFSVAGQYKQAFFRINKNYKNIATLEFKLEVLADMVVPGMVARDYISPLEDLLRNIKNEEVRNINDLRNLINDKVNEINNLMQSINQTNSSTLTKLNVAQTSLLDLQRQIAQEKLVTTDDVTLKLEDYYTKNEIDNTVNRIGTVERLDVSKFTPQKVITTFNVYKINIGNATFMTFDIYFNKSDNTQFNSEYANVGAVPLSFIPNGKKCVKLSDSSCDPYDESAQYHAYFRANTGVIEFNNLATRDKDARVLLTYMFV